MCLKILSLSLVLEALRLVISNRPPLAVFSLLCCGTIGIKHLQVLVNIVVFFAGVMSKSHKNKTKGQ